MPSQIGNDKRALAFARQDEKERKGNSWRNSHWARLSQFPDPTVISAARRATDYATVLLPPPGISNDLEVVRLLSRR